MKTVLLDTNFLLIPGQFGVDIFAELEKLCDFNFNIVVLSLTIEELNSLAGKQSVSVRDRKAVRLGLQLLSAKAVKVINVDRKVFKSADKAILDFAKGNPDVVVATQDKVLRQRLKEAKVRVIVLRQKGYLIFQ